MLILILGTRGVISRCNFRMRLFTEMNDMERTWWSPQNHRFLPPAGAHSGDYLPLQAMPLTVGMRRQGGCFQPLAEKRSHAVSAYQDSRSIPPGTAAVDTLGVHGESLRPSDREPPDYGKGHCLPRRFGRERSDPRR